MAALYGTDKPMIIDDPFCNACTREDPGPLVDGLCHWCQQAKDFDYCPECGEEHRGDCID